MADEQKNPSSSNNKSSSSSLKSSSSSSFKEKKKKVSSGEIPIESKGGTSSSFSGHYPNQREASVPDAATLRDQWRFAIRQYSKWYSHAWGTAILAGASFFALGWIIKGSNPIPSSSKKQPQPQQQDQEDDHKSQVK